MGSGFYAPPVAILLRQGCLRVRTGKGSHEIWESPITGARFPVSSTIASRHLANRILVQAGIDQKI